MREVYGWMGQILRVDLSTGETSTIPTMDYADFVGGVGIANVMVIAVLERRGEIGLRRALGATRRHVASQFLGEALLLAAMGGSGGILLGVAVTTIYANIKGWATLVPPIALIGGISAALLIGGIAGLYPATRAARLSPTEALRTT